MTIHRGGRRVVLDEHDFEAWVRAGRVPADTWINSPTYTKGREIRADELEVYHLWRPDPEEKRPATRPSVLSAIYLQRRVSVTEVLLLANLITSGILLWIWRASYPFALHDWTRQLKFAISAWYDFPRLIQPTFVHASPAHLFGNLLYLFAFGAVVEYAFGAWRAGAIYVLSAYAGAIASYQLLDSSGVSVGASGAVFGMIGATVVYLIRHRRDFHDAMGWRVRRIFIPLVLAVTVHSLSSGNLWAHAGGLAAGILFGLLLDRPLPPPAGDGALNES